MIDLVRLVFEVVTIGCFLPALVQLALHRRHFTLFVGLTQLVAAFAYCACDFLGVRSLFIPVQNWHFINDVLSLTYACLLIIHLCAWEDEERSMMLRYLAFFTAWIFKYRDAWDTIYWEALLVMGFVCVLVYSHVGATQGAARRRRFRIHRLRNGVAMSAAALACFLLHLKFNDGHRILMGLAHCGAGAACFELWNVLPAPVKEKRLDGGGLGGGAASSYV